MDAFQIASNRASSAKHGGGASEEEATRRESPEAPDLRLVHTLSACARCRKVRAPVSPARAGPLVDC